MSNDKTRSITDSENSADSIDSRSEAIPSQKEVTTDQVTPELPTKDEVEEVSQEAVAQTPEEKPQVDVELVDIPESIQEETIASEESPVEASKSEASTTEPIAEPTSEPTEETTSEPSGETVSEPATESTTETIAELVAEPTAEKTSIPTEETTSEPVAETSTESTEETTPEPIVAEIPTAETPVQEVEASEDIDDESSESDDNEEDEDDGDEDHDDESPNIPTDFTNLGKDELVSAAEESLKLTPRESLKRMNEIRPLLGDLLRTERRLALETFVDGGGEPDDFVYDDAQYRDRFKTAHDQAKEARKEERERIDAEKVKNLTLKKEILQKLDKITESDETESSLAEVKELQQEWKRVKIVPADKVKELWDSFHFYLNKFYDNHSINIELKELDRKKNLEVKIELCKKVDELSKENSLKRSFILLNKYQDEFRNTGPVPREYNKEIWERFQQACDKLYEQKKVLFAELEEVRTKNLELKEVLVEKSSIIAAGNYHKQKEWKDKSQELDGLMAEWKKIGPVPKSNNDAVWKSFRGSFNTFYLNKSQYFKQQYKERKANLILKEDICQKAEELKDSEDFNYATNEIIKLQKEWKEIGPVPEKISNAVWRRFRAACDTFFERKNKKYASRKEEETDNLKLKQELITRLNTLLEGEKSDDLLAKLKEIQQSWNQIGYVPIKQKKNIESQYHKVSDQVFEKFKLDKQSMKSGQMRDHYRNLADLPSGGKRLNDEEFKIKKKMGFLTGEMQTLENNMEFFGRSSGSQKLKKEIEDKIQKMSEQRDRLKQELKAIKNAKIQESAPAPTESGEA